MRIKNLYVVDVIKPMSLMGSLACQMEDACVSKNHICEKLELDDDVFFVDVENDKKYYQTCNLGVERVEYDEIPLSDYFYRIGLKKKNNHHNKQKVYEKVKHLKRSGIL